MIIAGSPEAPICSGCGQAHGSPCAGYDALVYDDPPSGPPVLRVAYYDDERDEWRIAE